MSFSSKELCPGWGSNSRPSDFSVVILDYETDALPTALPRPLDFRGSNFATHTFPLFSIKMGSFFVREPPHSHRGLEWLDWRRSFGATWATLVSLASWMAGKQSGAVGACWAHNPEVGRSKLLSAKTFSLIHYSSMVKWVYKCSELILITEYTHIFRLLPFELPKNWIVHVFHLQTTNTSWHVEIASDTFGANWSSNQSRNQDSLSFTTVLRPTSGVLLQWRNRLARRTYKQYLPKRCGGCEFEPHLEHVIFSIKVPTTSAHHT